MEPRSSSISRRQAPATIAVAAFLLLLAASVGWLDRPAALWGRSLAGSEWHTLANWITELGRGTWTFIAAAVLGCLGLLLRRPQLVGGSLLVAAAAAGAGILANLVKVLVGRARPKLFFAEEPFYGAAPLSVGYDFNSFPSGHAATAFATAAALWFLLPSGRWLWAALAVAVAVTRVVLGSHFLADVLAGGALGMLCGAALTLSAERWWPLGWQRFAALPPMAESRMNRSPTGS
jgi:membrane-associated phospholipid phosphatase